MICPMALTEAIRPTLQGRLLLPIKCSHLSRLRTLQREMKEAEVLPETAALIRISVEKSKAMTSQDRLLSALRRADMMRRGRFSAKRKNNQE